MSIRLYLTLNDDLARKLLVRADKEKADLNQILTKAAVRYLTEGQK